MSASPGQWRDDHSWAKGKYTSDSKDKCNGDYNKKGKYKSESTKGKYKYKGDSKGKGCGKGWSSDDRSGRPPAPPHQT